MTTTQWHGCYDSSWNGAITKQSFAHPAKFARGLIERIYDHCLERGYLRRGDVVGDPFGGIATGGIVAAYRGLNWVGCELEPRFVGFANENFELHRHYWKVMGLPTPRIIQGDSRKFAENVAGVVTSPPYADQCTNGARENRAENLEKAGIDSKAWLGKRRCTQGRSEGYGEASGQIGSLKSGQVDSVISSPPYAGIAPEKNGSGPDLHKQYVTYRGSGGGASFEKFVATQKKHSEGYGYSNGQISTLKAGMVQAVVSSPPYSDIAAGAGGLNTKPAKKPGQQSGRKAESASQDTDQRYGKCTGQISQLKGGSVDGVVSSPPYATNEKSDRQMSDDGKTRRRDLKRPFKQGHGCFRGSETYGTTAGQIGNETSETYWQAVDAVYRSCFQAIKPGGVLVLVVKDYCSKGKRVRLCDDTMRLLEHIGFVPLERIHAMLVSETVENGLFGEERTKKQRKSFFRRLYEAKLPEVDERRIDHEEVLICRRP